MDTGSLGYRDGDRNGCCMVHAIGPGREEFGVSFMVGVFI